MKLAELQNAFTAAMLDEADADAFAAELQPNAKLAAAKQLDIYRNSSRGGLSNALKITFPVVGKLVGEEFFNAMALQYCKQTNSRSFNLDRFTYNFPTFIANFSPAEQLPYLADIASLEYSWEQAFNGPELSYLDTNALAGLDETACQQLRFLLAANAQLLSSHYAVQQIWQWAQTGGEQQLALDYHPEPMHLIVWRPQYEVFIEHLTAEQAYFLQLVTEQQTLENISSAMQQRYPELELNNFLSELLARNWLSDFVIG